MKNIKLKNIEKIQLNNLIAVGTPIIQVRLPKNILGLLSKSINI
jgi:hypothetical protein